MNVSLLLWVFFFSSWNYNGCWCFATKNNCNILNVWLLYWKENRISLTNSLTNKKKTNKHIMLYWKIAILLNGRMYLMDTVTLLMSWVYSNTHTDSSKCNLKRDIFLLLWEKVLQQDLFTRLLLFKIIVCIEEL